MANTNNVEAYSWGATQNGLLYTEATEAVGGVYQLVNPENEVIVRTGRTNNLAIRQTQDKRNPEFEQFEFDIIWKTDDYNTQRGLEQ